MVALAIVIGLGIGVTVGSLGGGGSILAVPALVYALGQNAHSATTASLIVVGATASAGVLANLRRGHLRVREGLTFGALGVVGSVIGSRLSAGIASPDLLVGFSVVMLAAATVMFLRSRPPAPAAVASGDVPAPSVSGELAGHRLPRTGRPRPPFMVVVATASGVGLLTGFFGVGGGFIVVPALVLVMGFEMPDAVATALLVITINSGVSLLARAGTPVHIDWAVIGVFAAAAIGGSIFGTRVSGIVEPRHLSRAFSVLLVGVAVYTLARSLGQV